MLKKQKTSRNLDTVPEFIRHPNVVGGRKSFQTAAWITTSFKGALNFLFTLNLGTFLMIQFLKRFWIISN